MGHGKVEEIARELASNEVGAVLVDNDLTPAQVRNLEKAWKMRVIDRSELILDLFARRAYTSQARLQVELAQMQYLRPRLRRMWPHLERLEGAIGTRGPGETQLETDRRLIDKRISDLRARLREIERRRRRQSRGRSEFFTVGLIGYTNAGKSTLLNRLTGAQEFVADMPFATLDTRTRKWRLPDGRTVLLSDTVGFLQRLPHHLVASFHATLEEALSVDMLLHVVDAAHPDAATQMCAVEETLSGLTQREADLLVLNKIDRLADRIQIHMLVGGRSKEHVAVSALTGQGIPELCANVAGRLDARSCLVRVEVPLSDGRSIARVRAAGAIQSEHVVDDRALVAILRASEGALGSLRRTLQGRVRFELLQPAVEPYTSDGLPPP
jgi:GTP-binding protein HflX